MENVVNLPIRYRKPSPYKKPIFLKRVSQEQLKRLLELGYTVILK